MITIAAPMLRIYKILVDLTVRGLRFIDQLSRIIHFFFLLFSFLGCVESEKWLVTALNETESIKAMQMTKTSPIYFM